MSTIDKICNLLIEQHKTQKQLTDRLGIDKSTFTQWKNGKSKSYRKYIKEIASFFNVPIDTFFSDDKPIRSVSLIDLFAGSPGLLNEPLPEVVPRDHVYAVPIFNSVSAGFGAYASNDIVGYMPVIIDNPHDVDDTICIKVRGNSMYPKIEEGDTIVVRKQDAVDDGRIAVVLIGDDAVVKKVEFGKDSLTLISINPEYPPRTIEGPELENVRIVGLVRQVIKAV